MPLGAQMASNINQQNLRKALASKRRFNLLKRIVKRRRDLRKETKAVFPDPASRSREALTGNIDVIATHDEWFKLLSKLSFFFACCVLSVPFDLRLIQLSNLPVQPIVLGCAFSVFVLGFFLWVPWMMFLGWAQSWGTRPNTTFILGLVIPSAVLFVPKALIYTNWRMPEHWLWRGAVEGGFLLSVLFAVVFIATALASAFDALVKGRQRWHDPRAHLMKALFYALRGVIALKEDPRWANPEARKSLVPELEDAAICLEVIPERFPDRDRCSSTWNEQAYLRRASSIRDLKKWVLLPKAETRDCLERKLRDVLELVAVGDWDGLPQMELPGANVSWWRRVLVIIRSITIAAIPPVAVIVFGSNLLQGEIKTYVTAVAWIWALINLLAMLDPRFGEKLSAFKDLPSFLPFGGKSKER